MAIWRFPRLHGRVRTPPPGSAPHSATPALQSCFSLGLRGAAARLGVCATTLKRHCRKHGILKWPNRELKKYNRVRALQEASPDHRSHAAISMLLHECAEHCSHPDCSHAVLARRWPRYSGCTATRAPGCSCPRRLLRPPLLRRQAAGPRRAAAREAVARRSA